jgi:hypothetical protein
MADVQPGGALPDMTPINHLIAATRRLLRTSWVATGLGLVVGSVLGTLVAVLLADLAVTLWPAFRLAGLLLVLVPSVWALVQGVVRPLLRRLGPPQVARRIEAHLPGIHNRLLSCVDLASGQKAGTRSTAFHRRLVQEALDRIRNFRPSAVVDYPRLRRAALFAAASVASFAIAFGVFSDRMPTAMARIFSPFADIPPATGVAFDVAPGDAKVLRGDDIRFNVAVTRGAPEDLRLELLPQGGGTAVWYKLQQTQDDSKHWGLTLAGFERSFAYRVHGGGTWSRKHAITLVERPAIAGLVTRLHYPDYMGETEPRASAPNAADVTGPEGSRVEVVVEAEGDVAEGEIQLLNPRSRQVAIQDRPERVWQIFEFVPPGSSPEGGWEWDLKLRGRPAHFDPPNGGHHGHQVSNMPPGFAIDPGEDLFAYVYVPADQKVEALMLQWHDGAGWEHRAFWGDDKIGLGQKDTPGHRRIGPLPETGRWVRLEVPAALVGMEGKELRGISFQQFGGKALWHRAGTLPGSHVEQRVMELATSFSMKPLGERRWAGSFPLERDGFYRVELRNELGHTNKPMKEAKLVALPDNPPQIVLERPAADLTLSEPKKVPIVVAAYDDYGIADIVIATQKGDSGGFVGRPVKRYEKPVRSDTLVASLDLGAMGLKLNDTLRYRVEVRDRKGQSAQTKEYLVRIAADNNAADRQLAEFEKSQDAFGEKLTKLIAEQAKVQENLTKLPAKYADLEKKLKAARAEARPAPNGTIEPAPTPPLDPEKAKQLEELRKELNQLAGQEEQNTQLAQQVSNELKQAAERAGQLAMLPAELAEPMKALHEAFQQAAVNPLQQLAQQMRQGTDVAKTPPDPGQLQARGEQVQHDLEAMKERLDALARARKGLEDDAAAALAKLRQERLGQEAAMAAADLKELHDFLDAMRQELKRLEGNQEQLLDAAAKSPEMLLPDVENRQDGLEAMAKDRLDQARALQDAEQLKAMKRPPKFPDAPYQPEGEDAVVPPAEEDTDEPLPNAAKKATPGAEKAKADTKKNEDGEEEDPLFMPALGGPRPKLDPRFANKLRPVAKKKAEGESGKEAGRREDLRDRGEHTLAELNAAEGSLASDEGTLEQLMRQLQGNHPPAQPHEGGHEEGAQPPAGLEDAMRSEMLQQARAMAERMRGLRSGQLQARRNPNAPPNGQPTPHAPSPSTQPNLAGHVVQAETRTMLEGLDLNARTVILKMPPRVREELLRGMREEGPEGYSKFIQDYFKRLSEAKAP